MWFVCLSCFICVVCVARFDLIGSLSCGLCSIVYCLVTVFACVVWLRCLIRFVFGVCLCAILRIDCLLRCVCCLCLWFVWFVFACVACLACLCVLLCFVDCSCLVTCLSVYRLFVVLFWCIGCSLFCFFVVRLYCV